MKQEFEMTQQEMDDIISINKDRMPVMKIGNVTTGMDLQERINSYWKGLGEKYGFRHMTVEPSARGKLFFLAEPKPIVKPKTAEEKKIDEYLGEAKSHTNHHVKDAIKRIVEQLKECEYETKDNLHKLEKNIAFIALEQLSQ